MLRKAIRWCAATLLTAAAATGTIMADDDSLLEKALEPEVQERVIDETVPEGNPAPPAGVPNQQPGPGVPNQLRQPLGGGGGPAQPGPGAQAAPGGGAIGGGAAIGGGVAVGGETTVVETPAPRTLFMPGAGPLGPFGEPIAFGSPQVCIGESLLLKGGPNGAPPGRVVMQVDRLIFDAEIVEWASNGVIIVMPVVNMLGPTQGMLHVIRADGVLSDTLPIILVPKN
jgi:hypothetical protein